MKPQAITNKWLVFGMDSEPGVDGGFAAPVKVLVPKKRNKKQPNKQKN